MQLTVKSVSSFLLPGTYSAQWSGTVVEIPSIPGIEILVEEGVRGCMPVQVTGACSECSDLRVVYG